MPKLSDLLIIDADIAREKDIDPVIYGIIIDVDDVTPPTGLVEAGIIANTVNGEISDEVIDVAISWVLAGISVTIELPAHVECLDHKRALNTVSAIGVNLSLLPPEGDSDELFDEYVNRLSSFTELYLKQANMTKFLYPITSYYTYLLMEVYSPESVENFAPTDPYVVESFHSKVTLARSDALKLKLKELFYDGFGGEHGFRNVALGMGGAILVGVEEDCIEELSRVNLQLSTADVDVLPIHEEPTE